MQRIDWNYLYSLVAFFIGGLAGFQGVYERYKKDSPRALTTITGLLYLFTRSAFPAVVFSVLYGSGLVVNKLLLTAFACGTGAELFLRTKVFIRQEQTGQGTIEDLLKGPLDLLHWYQNLLLGAAASDLAERKKTFVKTHLPQGVDFPELYRRTSENMGAWQEGEEITTFRAELEKLKAEFDSKVSPSSDRNELAQLNQSYRFKLAYLIYNHLGRKAVGTLLSR